MLSRTNASLQIDSRCRQWSCRFEKDLLEPATASRFGLVLPASLAGAVPKRQAEFLAGRYCAREALLQLGGDHAAIIGIGAQREPLWPEGITGSITHTRGFAAAVVARSADIRALGIDTEIWMKPALVTELGDRILTRSECFAEHSHLFATQQQYLTLVFSAKEALYKCLFPLVKRFFGFQAAVITPLTSGAPAGGKFRFELLEDLSAEFPKGYSGYGSYSSGADLVHTAVLLQA